MRPYWRSIVQLAAAPLGLASDIAYEWALLLEAAHQVLVGEVGP